MGMSDEPITVREAARRLGVHENTIRNWQKKGIIGRSIVYPSGIRRFSAQDIERMRREMWEQFAPATEMPAPRRPCRVSGGQEVTKHG
jgi:excisionase family DNA binding protein